VSEDVVITQWYGDQLVAKYTGKVVDGMDRACRFVRDNAKSLARVRTGRMREGIDYVVSAHKEEVDGFVGVTRKSGAFWARFVELGTKGKAGRAAAAAVPASPGRGATRAHQVRRSHAATKAYPFLRPAVFNHGKEILRLIAGGE
jgi:hypothetical protein